MAKKDRFKYMKYMKKLTIVLFTLAVMIIIGGVLIYKYWWIPQYPIVGGDKDEHGCIGSAGYSWCDPKNKCLRIWEEACFTSPEQEIQYQLAQKYNKPITDITVVATKKTADYMVGRVSFAAKGLPAPGEGGMFLAVKEGDIWISIYDGNGSVDCVKLKQDYKFPQEMLIGFCD